MAKKNTHPEYEEEDVPQKKPPKSERILFVRDMPKTLMLAFKAKCILRNITIKEGLIRLIRTDLKDTEVKEE